MKGSVAILVLLMTTKVFAWGAQGHKIVAQIADDHLTPSARKAIVKILGDQTMVDVSNWADSIKSDPKWDKAKPWHYVTIPDGETYDSITHDPEGDVITAITEMVNVLKKSSSTLQEKKNALRFIIHFVGDMHQPLHVGRETDRGGNSIKVVFDGRSYNLHSLWDSAMISSQGMDYAQYAEDLQSRNVMKASYDLPGISFSQIITEGMGARKSIYRFGSTRAPYVLNEEYMDRNLAVMNSGLLMGGKRLASLLNTIF